MSLPPVPATMATQHPDNASVSPYTGTRYVSAADEIGECQWCFQDLDVQEYMWDWEGKFVDEAVIDRLFQTYPDYFRAEPLGQRRHLTFRIPNIWEEASHRLPRAFMNLISAEQAAKRFGFPAPPLTSVILPMASSLDQLTYLHERFQAIAQASEQVFEHETGLRHIEVIPLFESSEIVCQSAEILRAYIQFLEEFTGSKPERVRVFLARSDPALNGGLIPTILAIKVALSDYAALEDETGVEIHPWIGGGALPFRGGINPHNIEHALQEYRGVSSLTVQSAFRCDYDLKDVKKAITLINRELPRTRRTARRLSRTERQTLVDFIPRAQSEYRSTLEQIADTVNDVAAHMPRHRERVQHIGIFGYSRGVGSVKLPRAIKFTGSLYSLGVPPELLGTGRALHMAAEEGTLDLLRECYPNLQRDLAHAGHYLNPENLEYLQGNNTAWGDIQTDMDLICQQIGCEVGPTDVHHILHRNMTSSIYHLLSIDKNIDIPLIEAAEIRRSLG